MMIDVTDLVCHKRCTFQGKAVLVDVNATARKLLGVATQKILVV